MNSNKLVTTEGQHFVDRVGRQVLLHGISLIDKNPATSYLGHETPAVFGALREWGLNCIRLGVIWDGVEPEPGSYNDAYLRGIDERIAWARDHGLYVYLDMHQDLYSALYSDGAPEWATLTHGAPHIVESPVWSDAYFSSPAVQAAWDSFWSNAPASDGVGLQDHYAAVWKLLAQRYAAEPHVIGYDLMNEPFPGTPALHAQMLMFATGAELLAQQPGMPQAAPEDLAAQWLSPEGRFALLQHLRDVNLYAQIMDATAPLYRDFERSALMPMYRRAAEAIRQVDPFTILFLETTMASNMGVYTGIEPLLTSQGERDPFQAYAPHGYDLVTDTNAVALASPERIRLIFERHAETAKRLGLPMLVGEWGAYGDIPGTLGTARSVVRIFEQLLCGETYWAYANGIDRTASFDAIHRPYPERVAGTLLDYAYEPHSGNFSCSWHEQAGITSASRFYLPESLANGTQRVELLPWGSGFEVTAVHPSSGNCYLSVSPTGSTGVRRLIIRS